MRLRIRGFTLIELIITIMVLSIIIMLAIPNFRQTINSQQQNSQFHQLKSVLESARSQALTFKHDVTVNLNSQQADTATSLNWHAENNNTLLESNSPFSIVFTANGNLKDFNKSTSTLSICNSILGTSKRLQLTRLGSIQMLAEGSCTP